MLSARMMMAAAGVEAGGGFSPTDIAGLDRWLKADAITGLSDGNSVATWEDSGANGWDVASTGSAPEYKTGIINSLPVVRFAADQFLQRATDGTTGSTNRTIFIVASGDNGPILSQGIDGGGGAGEKFAVSGEVGVRVNSGNRLWSSALSGFDIITIELNGTTTSDLLAWLGRTSLSVASTNNQTINTDAGVSLGKEGVNEFTGDIAETIEYNSALSSGDRESVWTYLEDKYAL